MGQQAVLLMGGRYSVTSGRSTYLSVVKVSVTLLDPSTGRETARYDHDEIIVRHSWSGDRLLLEDLQGRQVALGVAADGGQLTTESV